MAKQKTKNPGRPPDAAGAVMHVDRSPGPSAGKTRGKRKAQPDAPGAGKTGLVKRSGKGKKTLRKAVAPLVDPVIDAALAAARAARRPMVHKIGRGTPRLGTLERLELAVEEVRLGGRISARTRKLQGSGIPKMAQKVIEEAGEVAIEAVRGDNVALVAEAADLFYNLLVLLSAAGVPVGAVWSEMDRRAATLGMAEKLPKTGDLEV